MHRCCWQPLTLLTTPPPRSQDVPEEVSKLLGEANLLYASTKYDQALPLLMEVSRHCAAWSRYALLLQITLLHGLHCMSMS